MSSRAIHIACRPLLMSVLALECMLAQSAPAQVDYFPNIPMGSQRAAFETVSAVNAAVDLQEFPDGSGRFLANRSLNRLYIIQPSGSNSVFLQAGRKEDTVDGTNQGSTSISIHPDFADVNSPGYAKIYTLTADTMPTEPPDFASPGPDLSFQVLLTEWTMDDIRSDVFAGSSRVLMRVELKSDTHHYMNDLAFGPDESLYISLGDNLNRDLASSTGNIFGKILRIDPFGDNSANGQYGIPVDNPFISDPDSVGEIFAYGLRNPWRIWFDRATGDLFAGDVGWNSIEEVDRIVSGGNYGWPTKEGSFLNAREAIPDVPDSVTGLTKAEELGLIEPLFEYDHTDGESVIGGVVYRGSELPWLYGKVIFGDWDAGWIMAGDPETGEFFQLPFADGEVAKALGGQRFVSINEDLDGELYLLGGRNIVRITPLPGDINLDGTLSVEDVDALVGEIVAGTNDSVFDLTADGAVDNADLSKWLSDAAIANGFNAPYLLGDANLDGSVNASDLNDLAQNWLGHPNTWQLGDFNADGTVNAGDLNEIGQNWQASIPVVASQTTAVPEPATAALAMFALAAVACRRTLGTWSNGIG